jgi:hypothetical protein
VLRIPLPGGTGPLDGLAALLREVSAATPEAPSVAARARG